jgi:Transposase DDE domain
MDWEALFCEVDDFCQWYEPMWQGRQLESGKRKRQRRGRLAASEMMTILIAFHASHFRNFKHYYHMLLLRHRAEFPGLVSYSRFVEWTPSMLGLLCAYLRQRFGNCTGISFIDSTALAVCGNKRIGRQRVFPELPPEAKPRWAGFTASSCTW